ncbi:MAG TPA: VWA domain-containing protein [Terriglobia bacterium]|nr:VWA domain-containing protein [Terriglobia bacterium]
MIRTQAAFATFLIAAGLSLQVNDKALIQVIATVTDNRGRVISDLKVEDFELRQDDKSRKIESFVTLRDTPSSVGILLDTSGSMRNKIAAASAAIEDVVNGLHRSDQVFLMSFAEEARLVADSSDGRAELVQRLRRLTAQGEGAIYDAIHEGLFKINQARDQRKVILLVTDGADSVSARTFEQIMRELEESNVLLYAFGIPAAFGIGFSGPADNFAPQIILQPPQRGGQPLPIPLPGGRTIPIPIPDGRPQPVPRENEDRGKTVNMSVLSAMTEATGGRAWRVEDRTGRSGEPIDRIVAQIRSELRGQYLLSFVPDHPLKDGQWHEVSVRAKDPGHNVRVKKEYFAKR